MGLAENKKQEIYFKNIEIMCNIGVYKHEKEKPQRVIVNIKILLSDTVKPKNDKINETLNYNLVYKKIKEIAKSQHFNLVETLANQIFNYVITFEKITHLFVSISKPDIYGDCEEVGYQISSNKY
tara:strand:+ start:1716 stop:2090 length:375 start_codon:yes stop_codon:yes gene_type:complete